MSRPTGNILFTIFKNESERTHFPVIALDEQISLAPMILPVTLQPVSIYVNKWKQSDAGFVYVPSKQPPFASHWDVVVGGLTKHQAILFHLLLKGDGAQ
jgi:hypothetical protein